MPSRDGLDDALASCMSHDSSSSKFCQFFTAGCKDGASQATIPTASHNVAITHSPLRFGESCESNDDDHVGQGNDDDNRVEH